MDKKIVVPAYAGSISYKTSYAASSWVQHTRDEYTEYTSSLTDLNRSSIEQRISSLLSQEICIYCNSPLLNEEKRFSRGDDSGFGKMIDNWFVQHDSIGKYGCRSCGWWYRTDSLARQTAFEDDILQEEEIEEGVIKLFDIQSKEIPLIALRLYLRKHQEHISYLNPTVFEKLVGDIYKDYFHCEVRHVGGKGDNGIDLICVISDEPHLIQVKKTKHGTLKDGPLIVRALMGTAILFDSRKVHLVTSASQFTDATINTAHQYNNLKMYNFNINLVALNNLISMLNLANSNIVTVQQIIG